MINNNFYVDDYIDKNVYLHILLKKSLLLNFFTVILRSVSSFNYPLVIYLAK